MARVKLEKINDPEEWIKDLFKDDSMKKLYPTNPNNVLWYINNYKKDELNSSYSLKKIKNKLEENIKIKKNLTIEEIDILKKYNIVQEILEDSITIDRINDIKNNYNVNLNVIVPKCPRTASENVILCLLDLGMDPNCEEYGEISVIKAFSRERKGIAKAIIFHPNTNINYITKKNQSYIDIILEKKAFDIIEKLIVENYKDFNTIENYKSILIHLDNYFLRETKESKHLMNIKGIIIDKLIQNNQLVECKSNELNKIISKKMYDQINEDININNSNTAKKVFKI